MLLSLVIAVVFGVLAVFFANENQVVIQVRMLGVQLGGKTGIVIVVSFGLGALIGILMMLPAYLSQGWALIRARRRAEDLEHSAQVGQPKNTKQV